MMWISTQGQSTVCISLSLLKANVVLKNSLNILFINYSNTFVSLRLHSANSQWSFFCLVIITCLTSVTVVTKRAHHQQRGQCMCYFVDWRWLLFSYEAPADSENSRHVLLMTSWQMMCVCVCLFIHHPRLTRAGNATGATWDCHMFTMQTMHSTVPQLRCQLFTQNNKAISALECFLFLSLVSGCICR